MSSINLNIVNSSNFINVDISTTDYNDQSKKVLSLAFPKSILKHTFHFESRLKTLIEAHLDTNEKMEGLRKRKITTKKGKGKEYTIAKEQYKDAFSEQDVEKLATWIIDSFVKSKYKPSINAYMTHHP